MKLKSVRQDEEYVVTSSTEIFIFLYFISAI